MKRALLLFVVCSATTALTAQKVKVTESTETINEATHNTLVVSIYDAKPDDIEKEWKSKMKEYQAKVTSKKEIFADNAMIQELNGTTSIDIYARIEKIKDGESKLIVGFDLGGVWISSKEQADKYKVAEKLVFEFALKLTKEAVAEKRKAALKSLENLKGDQTSLEKKNKQLNEDIVDYQNKIKKAEADINTNNNDQAKKKAEIDAQQKIVDEIIAREKELE
jgi:hypothetical protein